MILKDLLKGFTAHCPQSVGNMCVIPLSAPDSEYIEYDPNHHVQYGGVGGSYGGSGGSQHHTHSNPIFGTVDENDIDMGANGGYEDGIGGGRLVINTNTLIKKIGSQKQAYPILQSFKGCYSVV